MVHELRIETERAHQLEGTRLILVVDGEFLTLKKNGTIER